MENILVALITGGLSLLGVVYTNSKSNDKMQAEMARAQAVTDTKIDELTREVREHNNFARRVPVLEAQMKRNTHDIEELSKYHKEAKPHA